MILKSSDTVPIYKDAGRGFGIATTELVSLEKMSPILRDNFVLPLLQAHPESEKLNLIAAGCGFGGYEIPVAIYLAKHRSGG